MSKHPIDLAAKLAKQKGIASIIVVFIITVLISLVSLGFARLMDRALRDVSNNQLGAAADYAAQSGLNDAISFVRSQKTITPVKNCADISNADTAIGGALAGKTTLNNNSTASDPSDDTKYTCVLIDPVPGDLAFQNIPQYKSQVVKLQPQSGTLSEVTFGWEASDVGSRSSNGLSTGQFLNERDWGSRRPVLRVTLYKVSGTAVPDPDASNQVKTFYLFPSSGAGNTDFSSTASGSVRPGGCTPDANSCKVVVTNLPSADYYVARLTPLYKAADVTITAKDGAADVGFKDAQTVIDVTGRSNTAVRRIQARVDTGIATTVNADDDAAPEEAIRSAGTICKRLIVPSSPPDAVYVDPVSSGNNIEACGLSGAVSTPPGPQVNLTANPTDAFTGDTITLTWTVDGGGIPIDRCEASNDGSIANWNGNVTPGNDSQSGIGPLDNTRTYTFTLTCYNIYNVPGQDTAQVSVTVKPVPPTVITTDVDGFGPPNATGRGTVNPNGFNVTECYLEWGPGGVGSPFPNRSNCSALPGSGTTPVGVQGYMSGLAGLSVYHYRVVATNSAGTSRGEDKCFKMNVADGGGGGMGLCGSSGGGGGGGGGGDACSSGGGSSGTPNPCVRGVSAVYVGPNTLNIQIWASHCYSGLSASWPGGGSGLGWAAVPDDNSSWQTYTVGASGAGGDINVTCSGNGTASGGTSVGGWGGGGGGCTDPPGCPPTCGGDSCGPPPCSQPPGCPPTCGGDACVPPPVCPPGYVGTPPDCQPVIGCFTAGSMVATKEGLEPIEQIGIGDQIIGWDTTQNKQVVSKVSQTFHHYNEPTLWVVTSSGSVQTTAVHPFWDGSDWVMAGELIAGQSSIYTSSGKLEKVLVTMAGAKRDVYNLEVDNSTHDYFVNGYLVHNKIMP